MNNSHVISILIVDGKGGGSCDYYIEEARGHVITILHGEGGVKRGNYIVW